MEQFLLQPLTHWQIVEPVGGVCQENGGHEHTDGSDMESIGRMSSEAEERLRRINIFISCNYNRDISVDVIARHVGMNRSALCTFYRRQTGKTIIEAVNARRFEVATNLLRRQELSIQQVCFSSGFRDVPYFFRLFKRQYGMTPKSYRQNVSNTTP